MGTGRHGRDFTVAGTLAGCVLLATAAISPPTAAAQTNSLSRGSAPPEHTCNSCHGPHAVDPKGLVRSRGTARVFGDRAYELDSAAWACLNCHASEEDMRASLTALDQVYTPGRGNLLIGPWLDDDHVVGRVEVESDDPTALAEPGSSTNPLKERIAGFVIGDFSSWDISCSACHNPHGSPMAMLEQDGELVVCGNCHVPSVYALTGHVTPSCRSCHRMHSAPGEPLQKLADSDIQCLSCHSGTQVPELLANPDFFPGAEAHPGEVLEGRCIDCHTIHDPDPIGGTL
jgi:predicted CXXCH cytochrome family protein